MAYNNAGEAWMMKNGEIFEYWLKNKDMSSICRYVESKIPPDVVNDLKETIHKRLTTVCSTIRAKWAKYHRSLGLFRLREKTWLDKELYFVVPDKTESLDESQAEENESRAKKKIKSLGINSEFLMPDNLRPARVRKTLSNNHSQIIPLTPEEALMFILENGFTGKQYNNIRYQNITHNSHIYPSYKRVLQCKLKRMKTIKSESVAEDEIRGD